MAARFWIGGSGNWDASTTTHWSATSGGSGGASVPTTSDDVTFDANSGSAAVTVTATANCASLTSSSAANSLTIGSNIINCVTTWTWTAGTLSAASSTINMSGGTGVFVGGGQTYGTVNATGSSSFTISGNNTFANLNRTGTAAIGSQLVLSANTQTITGTLTLNGNSKTNRLLVTSNAIESNRTLNAATVVSNGADFTSITAAGAANWDLSAASNYSGDAGGNSGITFTPAADQYFGAYFTGSNLRLPGVSGYYPSAPDSAALSITGDIDIRVRVALDDWTPAVDQALISKENPTAQRSYFLRVTTGGKLDLRVSSDGSAFTEALSSVATGISDGATAWVRVTWRASDGRTQFFTAPGSITSPVAADFSQLGTNITANVGALFNGTGQLTVGVRGDTGSNDMAIGNFYRAQVYNGIDGTLAFDADFTTRTPGTGSFTESSANAATVTVNTPNATWSGAPWTSRVPLPQDNVTVNVNTTGTLTADMPRLGANVTFTGFGGTASFASVANTLYGNLIYGAGMTVTGNAGVGITLAGRGSQTLTTNAVSLTQTHTFAAPGGTYTLQDNLTTAGSILLTAGTLTTGNNNINALAFQSSNTNNRTINLGSSTITLTGTTNVIFISGWGAPQGSFNAGTSTFVLSNNTSTAKTITPGGSNIHYYNLSITGGGSGSVVFSAFAGQTLFVDGTFTIGAQTVLTFHAGFTYTVGGFSATGSPNSYLYLPGLTGNYASTPDSAAISVTGDIDIRVRVAMDNWTPATLYNFTSKEASGTTRSYVFRLDTTGKFSFYFSADGTAVTSSALSSVATGATNGSTLWVRATRRSSDGRVQFFTASGALTSPVAADFTQLGINGVTSAGTIFDSTAPLEVGSRLAGANEAAAGKFYRSQIRNGLDGTLVFDADFTTKPFGANSFTESSANAATVSINGTGAQAGDGRILINSDSGGNPATLSKASGVVSADYLSITDSAATGGAVWYAGAHSTNVSGNSGWIFATPSGITKSAQYYVKKPYSVTKSGTYDVKAQAAVTKSSKYTIKTTQTAITKAGQYFIKTTRSNSRSAQYEVKIPLQIAKSSGYEVYRPVSVTTSAKYAIRQASSVSNPSTYDVRARAAITNSAQYTVTVTAPAVTKSSRYAIRFASVIQQKSAKYKVAGVSGITKSSTYVLLSHPPVILFLSGPGRTNRGRGDTIRMRNG